MTFAYRITVFNVIILVLLSCKTKQKNLNTRKLSDSKNLEAVTFLLSNMESNFAYKIGKIDSSDPLSFSDTLFDSHELTSEYLIDDINLAFQSVDSPIVNLNITKPIFNEYILPYRVGYEKINPWRQYFRARYLNYVRSFGKMFTVKDIIKKVREEAELWFYYDKDYLPEAKLSYNQDFSEIIKYKTPFDCEDFAMFDLYVFRSLGIPTAYEKIPFWGKFNYGHSETALLHEDGKFYPARVNDKMPFKYQIAKMYRRTYSKQPNVMKIISRSGEPIDDIPGYFNYDRFIDITAERTIVSNISLPVNKLISKKVGYLCVYNNGKWKPIEWGIIDKYSDSISFCNVGRKILYHLAYVIEGNLNLTGAPFVVDTIGNIKFLEQGLKMGSSLITNYDRNAPLKRGNQYKLSVWNSETFMWVEVEKFTTSKDSVILKGLSQECLMKIEMLNSNTLAVRPFTIVNERQIWW